MVLAFHVLRNFVLLFVVNICLKVFFSSVPSPLLVQGTAYQFFFSTHQSQQPSDFHRQVKLNLAKNAISSLKGWESEEAVEKCNFCLADFPMPVLMDFGASELF